MLLRHGADIKFIIKVAKKINDSIVSFVSVISRVLNKYNKEVSIEVCPDCGEKLIKENGCAKCIACGYSMCQ